MEPKVLLAKSLSLLYKESLIKDKSENSSELVRTVLETIKVPEISLGVNSERDIITALKSTVLEMCDNPIDHEYDDIDLIQRVRINTGYDDKLFEAIKQGIAIDGFTESSIKRSIVNTRKSLANFFKEQKINKILNDASFRFKYQRETIKDINQFLTEIVLQLEPLQLNTNSKDPAVMNDIDIGDDDSLSNMYTDVKNNSTGSAVYRTGWKALDRMLQGGFRPGLNLIGALQHKYKTGFTLSLFKQIALSNIPNTTEPGKKPLLLRISFEDDLELNLQFLYQSLMYDETRQPVDINEVDAKEMALYVKTRLQVNGFHIKMMRVDPSQWSYKSICNKIIELESEGYSVEVLMLDYLGLVPTVGCINSGPAGTDIRDMFRRIRNFCCPKKIACITPHQLSTEAKQLLRGGMPEDQFVKEIAEKGYYAGCKQLDQEVDLELYIHIFKHQKEWYLSCQRGKHRIPTIVNDNYKYYIMRFPRDGMPIPMDNEDEDQSMSKLTNIVSNAPDELFSI